MRTLPIFPDTTHDHAACRPALVEWMAGAGVEVTATTAAPLIRTPYTTDPFVCPHGATYWMEPTSDQIAAWTRDGVA